MASASRLVARNGLRAPPCVPLSPTAEEGQGPGAQVYREGLWCRERLKIYDCKLAICNCPAAEHCSALHLRGRRLPRSWAAPSDYGLQFCPAAPMILLTG